MVSFTIPFMLYFYQKINKWGVFMNETIINVIPGKSCEKPMRNILGMNNSLRIGSKGFKGQKLYLNEKKYFDALNLRHFRHHDAVIENPGFVLIDIHRIFPFFHLDENDERNYFFAQTDDYLSEIANGDTEYEYRLGETIDHSGYGRLIDPPDDVEKWARVCRNIIGHYKNGEMNGLKMNLTRVCVWEEPDVEHLFGNHPDVEKYAEMFCTVYKLLKKDFPDLRIGGPTIAWNMEFADEFMRLCKENGVTPDYMTRDVYRLTPDEVVDAVYENRNLLDKYAFTDSGVVISEFHLRPKTWEWRGEDDYVDFYTSKSAAYSVSSLTRLMDIDWFEVAYFYSWAIGVWGIADMRTKDFTPLPVYYGLLFFQKLATECTERIKSECSDVDVTVLSGKTKEGKIRVLISCFDTEDKTIECRIADAKSAKLYCIKSDYNQSDATDGREIIYDNDGFFSIEHTGGCGVYLLEL